MFSKSVGNSIAKRDCGCAGKGPHKVDCVENPKNKAMAITKEKSTSTGMTFRPVAEEKTVVEEYPEDYKYFDTDNDSIVVIMENQHTTSKYCSDFREVVERSVKVDTWYATHAPDDNWYAIIPKILLERSVEHFDYIRVTIEGVVKE